MERLSQCIEENADLPNPAGRRMLPEHGDVYPFKRIFDYADVVLKDSNT